MTVDLLTVLSEREVFSRELIGKLDDAAKELMAAEIELAVLRERRERAKVEITTVFQPILGPNEAARRAAVDAIWRDEFLWPDETAIFGPLIYAVVQEGDEGVPAYGGTQADGQIVSLERTVIPLKRIEHETLRRRLRLEIAMIEALGGVGRDDR